VVACVLSKLADDRYPRLVCLRRGLYQASIQVKTARRASVLRLKLRRSSSSDSRLAKKLSAMALSWASPTGPSKDVRPSRCSGCRRQCWCAWAALVTVVDHGVGPALLQRHAQRRQHQFGGHALADCPPDRAPAPRVQHYGRVDETGAGRHLGHVGDSQSVRSGGYEAEIDQIPRWPAVRVAPRGEDEAAPATDAGRTCTAHQSGDAVETLGR